MEQLPLKMDTGKRIIFDKDRVFDEINDLEFSLDRMNFLNNLQFSKKVMFSHEIKSNNSIEGITVDIDVVKALVEKEFSSSNKEDILRVSNVSDGYRFILENKDINKYTLKKLYDILSKGLLDSYEYENMGEFYRSKEGVILFKGRLDGTEDKTIDPKYIEGFMDDLIEYINTNNSFDTMTEYFIKSM